MISFKGFLVFAITAILSFSAILGQIEKTDDEATEFRKVPLTDARIKFNDTEFDFGSIVKGSSVPHSFWFSNEGKDTLIITKVKPTCGCTIASGEGLEVPPGGKASIDVVFNSARFNGKITKSINVETNDRLNPYLEIRFKATINNPLLRLSYSPLQADFKTVAEGQSKSFTIDITNTDSTDSKLILIDKPSADYIATKLARSDLKPNETTTLKLTLKKDLEPGPYLSAVTLEAEGKYDSRITIPVSATIGDEKASN